MTDEMTVQAQRPSAVPYLLGGATLGGVGGYFSPVGVQKPKYASYQDILKESEDTFKKNIDNSKDDVKKVYQEAQKQKGLVETAQKTYDTEIEKIMNEHAAYDTKVKTFGEAFDEAAVKVKNAENDIIDKLKNKIKAGEIDGITKEAGEKLDDKALADKAGEILKDDTKLSKAFKEDELEALKKAKESMKNAKETLEKEAKEAGVKAEKILSEEGKNLKEAAEKTLKDVMETAEKALKDDLSKIKVPNKVLNAIIGAGILGLGALLLRPKAE